MHRFAMLAALGLVSWLGLHGAVEAQLTGPDRGEVVTVYPRLGGPNTHRSTDGKNYMYWSYPMKKGDTMTVSVRSAAFLPYVIARGPSGTRHGPNGVVTFRASADGNYTIIATHLGNTPRIGAMIVTFNHTKVVAGDSGNGLLGVPFPTGPTRRP